MTYLYIWIFLSVQFVLLALAVWRIWCRISHIEMSVVRQVMEDSPGLVDRIIEVQRKLYRDGGFGDPIKALHESRRLHGLSP